MAGSSSMKGMHWFPFLVADWLSSPTVQAMLPEQRGAYIQLLALSWGNGRQEPSITADDDDLAQLSGLSDRWKTLGAKVRSQFVERDGRLYNAKLSDVWREQQEKHSAAVSKGSKGAAAKAERRSSSPPATPSTSAEVQFSLSSAKAEGVAGTKQSESDTDTELEETKKETDITNPARARVSHNWEETFPEFAAFWKDPVSHLVAGEFLGTLQKLESHVRMKFVAETNKALQENCPPAAIVDAMNDWTTMDHSKSPTGIPNLMFWRECIKKARANLRRDASRKSRDKLPPDPKPHIPYRPASEPTRIDASEVVAGFDKVREAFPKPQRPQS